MSEEEFPLTEEEFNKISPEISICAAMIDKIFNSLYHASTKIVDENKSVYVVLALLAEVSSTVFSNMIGKETSIEEVFEQFSEKLRELIIGG